MICIINQRMHYCTLCMWCIRLRIHRSQGLAGRKLYTLRTVATTAPHHNRCALKGAPWLSFWLVICVRNYQTTAVVTFASLSDPLCSPTSAWSPSVLMLS
jgi:hypothetical protein